MRKYLSPNFLFVFAIVVFLFFSIQILCQTGISRSIEFDVASKYATVLGGFFSFISVLLIYKTLTQQSDSFNETQFENRLFEMIRIHRSNIIALKMRSPDTKDDKSYDGYKVIREINKQILSVIKIIDLKHKIDNLGDLYCNNELMNADLAQLKQIDRNIDLIKLNKINIAYLCVFYGVSEDGRHTLNQLFKNRYKEKYYKPLIQDLEKVKAKWDSRRVGFVKYYGGHQYRLGHLFRHLYHVVTYVNDNSKLSYDQKYEYIKLLRAQLSTYEQSLLFFNSLSGLGAAWEINIEVPQDILIHLTEKKLNEYRIQRMLITKYNFIRNIPNEFVIPISVKEFYPDIVFDGEGKNSNRIGLEKIYRM